MTKVIDFAAEKANRERKETEDKGYKLDHLQINAAFLSWLDSEPEPRREDVTKYDDFENGWVEPN